MVVVIRMKRSGRRKRPCYRISVADSRFPRDGRTIETLGLYDPIAPDPEARITLDVERAKHWIQVGAQPSDTVNSIFHRFAVYADRPERTKRDRSGRKRATQAKAARKERKEQLQARRAAKPSKKKKPQAAASA